MTIDPVFVHDGGRYRATDLAHGPWYEGALHGGAVAALLVHEIERHPATPGLRLARLTCEFVRPVPSEGLAVTVTIGRPGRRVTLLEAALRDVTETEVCRARALLLAPSDVEPMLAGEPDAPPPGPEHGSDNDWHIPGRRTFATDAMEVRFVRGAFRVPGAATAWFRLRGPLIGDAAASPLALVAAASDFGNGIASVLSWDEHLFINPDLTVYIERPPVDEWVALESRMHVTRCSVPLAESVLWDRLGRIGTAVQSLIVGVR
ncbi:MAG: thioesterase family protein [Solirubrobacteraceae bacterium]